MSDIDPRTDALKRAIEMAGGITAVAALFSITPQAVWQWPICPPARVFSLSVRSGVPPHELRPDIFPNPQHADAPSSNDGENGAAAASCHANAADAGLREGAR